MMRRYGSTKRNPNPPWPGIQTPVVLPPGSTPSAIGRVDNTAKNNDAVKVMDREKETIHERDGLIPIMSYMTDSNISISAANEHKRDKKCSNMSVTDYLCDKTGSYARVEFLFGENTHVEKNGILESVGTDFVVLTEAGTGSRIVCSSKNIKFINIYNIK